MIEKIELIVCNGEGLEPYQIHTKSREQKLCETRHKIMYFARIMTRLPLREIAGYFGQDHATAMHSTKVVQNMIDTDGAYRANIKMHEINLSAIKIDRMISDGAIKLSELEVGMLNLEQKITTLRSIMENIKTELTKLNN